MANDNDLVCASSGIKRVEHPVDQRFACCYVQYLGQVAAHTGAFSSGEYDSKR